MIKFILSIFELLIKSFEFLLSHFLSGIQFFISLFTNIPLLILDLFNELPEFLQIGLSGAFCLLLLVVFLKLLALFKIS